MPRDGDRDTSYQGTLRALGAYLDQEHPGRFTLIEVPDGFFLVVRHAGQSDITQAHLRPEKLAEQAADLLRTGKRRANRLTSTWPLASTNHQDFMRALGHELDQEGASGILIDELEDGLLVTYSFLDPSQGYQYQKRTVTLHRDHIERILGAARGRRTEERRGLLRL